MSFGVVAIDGPSASGKSTVARRVARELGALYVDSGALYRGIAWNVLEKGGDPADWGGVSRLLAEMDVCFFEIDGEVRFRIDGKEPGKELRTPEIDRAVSPVAANPDVRSRATAWLRAEVSFGVLVMEGRDIGTAVFPQSGCKFYLNASAEERSRRRYSQFREGDGEADGDDDQSGMNEVEDALQARDRVDSTRKTAPLKVADDAVVIDSTKMDVEQVVSLIVTKCRQA